MVLVLAVHSFEQVTAKVPFAVILLQDLLTNKKTPPELKCRQLIPTSGSRSTSLWDAPDCESLLQWLNENVNVDCSNEVCEVQEEFGLGLGEVTRARAAERVAAGARDLGEKTANTVGKAASAVSHQAQEIDHKLKISERAAATATAVKESAAVKGAAAFFGRVGSGVKQATNKVVESERVSAATEKVGTSFKKLSSTVTGSFRDRGRVNSSEEDAGPLGEDQAPHYVRQPAAEYEAPAEREQMLRNPTAAAGAGATAPVASPPLDTMRETASFTLDDTDSPPAKQ